jgi:hypothetical protein
VSVSGIHRAFFRMTTTALERSCLFGGAGERAAVMEVPSGISVATEENDVWAGLPAQCGALWAVVELRGSLACPVRRMGGAPRIAGHCSSDRRLVIPQKAVTAPACRRRIRVRQGPMGAIWSGLNVFGVA